MIAGGIVADTSSHRNLETEYYHNFENTCAYILSLRDA